MNKPICKGCGIEFDVVSCDREHDIFTFHCSLCDFSYLYVKDVTNFCMNCCEILKATERPHHYKGYTYFTGIFECIRPISNGKYVRYKDSRICVTRTKDFKFMRWDNDLKWIWKV